jgi:putative FmdB family regulatory protein
MPIYEYDCPRCGHFELMRKISDPELKRCPTCKGKIAKLISNSSFQLKGSGWYVTDYARKSSGAAKTDAKADTGTSSKETKTEEKPAAKSTENKPAAAA